ncbi:MAG: MDR family MFS transporter [Haloferacaceae archaeon]
MTDRRLATLGMMLGIFLAGIDGTIVSTAMPTVVASLGGLERYPWVFAAYMLFAAVTMPVFGRLADIYGRKRLFYVGIAAFVLGSVLAGAARSMLQLVAFRAVQGVGAGAMFSIPYTVLGVIYPPDERGKAIGYGSAVWGVSSVIGPLLGYLIVATLSWRWVFYLSVPVGAAAALVTARSLDETTGDADRYVDVAGATLLAAGVGAALVALEVYDSHPRLAAALVPLGIALLGLFYVAERRARVPILPLSLFRDRTFVVTNAAGFLTSFAIFAALTYDPLFVQSVRGSTASAALIVFPISIGWSGTSFVSGRLVNRFGERRLATAGALLMTASFVVAALWTVATPLWAMMLTVFLTGVGMGTLTPPILVAVQNHLGTERMGLATSSQQFFRNLGGTVGVAVLGVVLNVAMRERLAAVPGVSDLDDLQELLLRGGDAPPGIAAVMADGLTTVFAVAALVCLVAAAAAARIPVTPATAASGTASGDD